MNSGKITTKSLQRAFKGLLENNHFNYGLFWVDNKHFYLGEIAKQMGFQCTEEEIAAAKSDGFIKNAQAVKLYLAKRLSNYS